MKSLMEQDITECANQLEERFKKIALSTHAPTEMELAIQQTSINIILAEVLGGTRFVCRSMQTGGIYEITILDTLQQQQRRKITFIGYRELIWPDISEFNGYGSKELERFIAEARKYGETQASISQHYGYSKTLISFRLYPTGRSKTRSNNSKQQVASTSLRLSAFQAYINSTGIPFLLVPARKIIKSKNNRIFEYPKQLLDEAIKQISMQDKLAYIQCVEKALETNLALFDDAHPEQGYICAGNTFGKLKDERIQFRAHYGKKHYVRRQVRVFPSDLIEKFKKCIKMEKQSLTQKEATND